MKTAQDVLTSREFLPYMTKSHARSIGSNNITCQEMASGFYIFVMDGTGRQPYCATKVKLDELEFYLDKAIEIAKMWGVK